MPVNKNKSIIIITPKCLDILQALASNSRLRNIAQNLEKADKILWYNKLELWPKVQLSEVLDQLPFERDILHILTCKFVIRLTDS